MARYITPNYQLNLPDLNEPPDVPADLRVLGDRLDVVLGTVDPGRDFYSGTGEPAASLGVVGDVYFELP